MINLFSYFLFKVIEKACESDIGDPKFKREILEEICNYSTNTTFLDLSKNNIMKIFQGYLSCGCHAAYIEMQLKYRALLRASSDFAYIPFEVGLSFDPFLCVPYIPASSIKGAVRAAWRKIEEKNLDKGFEEKEEDKIFGKGGFDGSIGTVIFSDALPTKPGKKGFILYPDIITPHYSKGGEDVFDETQASPTPIPHLSIAPETVFSFVIAIPKRTADINKEEARKIFRRVLMATNVALKLGIGARTSVGYGVFELRSLKINSPR